MKTAKPQKKPSAGANTALLATLQARFAQNPRRHAGLDWARVAAKLAAQPAKLRALAAMEETGGEPDVAGFDPKTGEFIFVDCAAQSPAGRTSVCYDRAGLESRKEHRPKTSALDLAAAMGVELLTAEHYRDLQKLGEFDTKSSSWVQTPAEIRELGGALFGDRRYGQVFIYHNGAQSYYSGRGFRASLRV
jgi:hypothetical protein